MKSACIILLLLCISYSGSQGVNLYISIPDTIKQRIAVLKPEEVPAFLLSYAKNICYNDFDLALSLARLALHKSDSSGNHSQKAEAYYALSEFFMNKNLYSDAMDNVLEALRIYEKINDLAGMSACYKNIGIIYSYENNIDKALSNFKMALELAIKSKNNPLISNGYNNLGVLYCQQGNLEEGLKNHKLALEFAILGGDSTGMAKSYLNIGVVYRNQKKTSLSIEFLKKAIPVFEKVRHYRGLSTALSNLGMCYTATGRYADAEQIILKSIEIGHKINDKEIIANAYYGLTTLFEDTKNYEKALKYYKLVEDLEDSVLNKERSEQIAEMQARFDAEKKDNEIKTLLREREIQLLSLRNQRLTLLAVAISSLAFFLFIILFFRYKIFKEKQLRNIAILETEHNERLRIAKDMHDELGSGLSKILIQSEILRNSFTSENDKVVIEKITSSLRELSEKMADLVWSLHTENCTFENFIARLREYAGDFFENTPIELDTKFPESVPEFLISKKVVRNTFLSFKESLNNAAKHSNASKISVSVAIDHEKFLISVIDNGKGFKPENKALYGNGIHNMKNRIETSGGEFLVESEPGNGTKILMRFPLAEIIEKNL